MNRDPFLRLALIAGSSLYALGLAAAWRFLGPQAAIFAGCCGFAVAVGLSYEKAPEKPEPDPRRRQRQPAEGTRGFQRVE